MRLILILIGLVLVGGLAWVMLSEREASRDSLVSEGGSRARDEMPPETNSIVTPVTPRGLETETSGQTSKIVRQDGIRLRVVDPFGEGLANVQVSFFDQAGMQRDSAKPSRRSEYEAKLRTDADGYARLPKSRRAWVSASWKGLWGHKVVDDEGDEELALRHDRSLEVLVRDVEGKVAPGVPLLLDHQRPGSAFRSIVSRVVSNEEGLARFEHLQRFLDLEDLSLTFAFPLADVPSITVDEPLLVKGRVELRLPPTGSVVLRAVDLKGNPVAPEAAHLNLQCRDAKSRWGFPPLLPVTPDSEGRTRYPYVGVGLSLEATLTPVDPSLGIGTTRNSFVGPGIQGEEVASTLVLGEVRHPVLCARIVDGDGKPWSGGWLQVIDCPDGGRESHRGGEPLRIAEDGRVRIPMDQPRESGAKHELRLVELSDSRREVEGPIELTLDVTAYVEARDHDLGDLIFDHGELLAEGKVVDRITRQPIEGGGVAAWRRIEPHGRSERVQASLRQLGKGGFRLFLRRGQPRPVGDLYLNFWHRYCKGVSEARAFRIGDRGIVIEASLKGRVRGRVEAADGGTLPPLEVVWRAAGTPELRAKVGRTGEFSLLAPPTESGTLLVRPRSMNAEDNGDPLATLSDLKLVGGEDCSDPRLARIRITELPEAITLSFTNRKGSALPGVLVQVKTASGRRFSQATDSQGRLSLPAGVLYEIAVQKNLRYCTVKHENVGASRTIVLDDIINLRVRLLDLPFKATKKSDLGLVLLLAPTRNQGAVMPMMSFEPPADLIFKVWEPGSFEIRWHVRKEGRFVEAILPPPGEAQRITVKPEGGEQIIEVRVPAKVREALIEARAKRETQGK